MVSFFAPLVFENERKAQGCSFFSQWYIMQTNTANCYWMGNKLNTGEYIEIRNSSKLFPILFLKYTILILLMIPISFSTTIQNTTDIDSHYEWNFHVFSCETPFISNHGNAFFMGIFPLSPLLLYFSGENTISHFSSVFHTKKKSTLHSWLCHSTPKSQKNWLP